MSLWFINCHGLSRGGVCRTQTQTRDSTQRKTLLAQVQVQVRGLDQVQVWRTRMQESSHLAPVPGQTTTPGGSGKPTVELVKQSGPGQTEDFNGTMQNIYK